MKGEREGGEEGGRRWLGGRFGACKPISSLFAWLQQPQLPHPHTAHTNTQDKLHVVLLLLLDVRPVERLCERRHLHLSPHGPSRIGLVVHSIKSPSVCTLLPPHHTQAAHTHKHKQLQHPCVINGRDQGGDQAARQGEPSFSSLSFPPSLLPSGGIICTCRVWSMLPSTALSVAPHT